MANDHETLGERMSSVETWIKGHEQRCDDRQIAMGREIGELKDGFSGLTKAAWAIAIALLAWTLIQLYGHLSPPGLLPAPAPARASGPAGP